MPLTHTGKDKPFQQGKSIGGDTPSENPAERENAWWRTALLLLLLAVMTVGFFWPVTSAHYINYDDPDYVTQNYKVLNGLTKEGVHHAFTKFSAFNWHPLTWISHMLDVELFGPGPTGPHCVNLVLHVLNAMLLFLVFRRMTGMEWQSFLVATLFAVHPLHVESVAWVSERKDVLSTFFMMLTLLAYVRHVEWSRRKSESGGLPSACRSLWHWVAILCYACGLMSKPMLVTVPFLLLLLDFWPLARIGADIRWRTAVALVSEKAAFFLLSAASCIVTLLAQQDAMPSLVHLPVEARIANALVSYVRYLAKTFWPSPLAVPYSHPGHWPLTWVAGALLLVAVISLLAWRARRRRPYVLTGWLWFIGTLVPVIGLVQVGTQAIADRYTYIPLIGVFVIVAWGISEMASHQPRLRAMLPVTASLGILACGLLTWRQSGYWRNNETLFRHSAAVTTGNYTALSNIGVSLVHQKRFDEAIAYFRKALSINPDYVDALNDLGAALEQKGGGEDGEEYFRQALQINPSHRASLYNLGNSLVKNGDLPKASEAFEGVLRLKADDLEARNNLANTLATMGRHREALAHYRTALRLKPQDPRLLRNLGTALVNLGELDEAISCYKAAIKLEPHDPATRYSCGLALALQKQWPKAIEQYTATLSLGGNNAEVQYNLGYARRMQGDLPEAALRLREALRMKPEFPWALYNLACVLSAQGHNNDAIPLLKEALRLDPAYKEAALKLGELDNEKGAAEAAP